MEPVNTPATELFWSLADKADRRFSKVRDLPNFGPNRNDAEFSKAFKSYTQLWKMQQEQRKPLMDAGLKRWEIGEIASRVSQLYFWQYQRSGNSGFLSEAYIFYEAVLEREYFLVDGAGGAHEPALAKKQLRFLARFLIVCLLLGRREMVAHLLSRFRSMLDECRRNFQETDFNEWKHAVREITRFLKADSPFMNMRPLRYSYIYDIHPNSISEVSSHVKRRLVLHDAILSSYSHNEVKFMELTLDTFRMLQCLEWEPCGCLQGGGESGDSTHQGSGPRFNMFQDIRDPSLPPNPRKVTLFRPSIAHFLTVLSTICEEFSHDGILLIYLSAAGESGFDIPFSLSFEASLDTAENVRIASPLSSPTDGPSQIFRKENVRSNNEACLWLGAHGSKGSNYLYPSDLIPFTRRPLFLVIDSYNSHAFKAIHGVEKGETTAMLLSPSSRSSAVVTSNDSSHYLNGSQFTMFLTAPVQAFCLLLGISSMNIDKDTYNNAEKLFSLSLSEWETTLVTSDSLHPVWAEVLGDPLLRRLLLRFIFCRAVLCLYSPTYGQDGFQPSCLPDLPDSVHPKGRVSQSAVMRLAKFFNATKHFVLCEEAVINCDEPVVIKSSDIYESHFSKANGC